MPNSITIENFSGVTIPFSAYTCDVYGNNCEYVGIGSTLPIIFTLPPQFNMAPSVVLKLNDGNCEIIKIINCS